MLECYEVSLELVTALRVPVEALSAHDPDLAKQVRRAAPSIAMNVDEGARRVGRDRAHFYRIAAGSAAEVRTALRIAAAWGYLDTAQLEQPLALLDRVLAMLLAADESPGVSPAWAWPCP